MKTGMAFLGCCGIALCSCWSCSAEEEATTLWRATDEHGVSVTVEAAKAVFAVTERVDLTVTIRNRSDVAIAFAKEPLFVVVPWEFRDPRRDRIVPSTFWKTERERGVQMSGSDVGKLKPGEELVFRENLNIQFDLTGVPEVQGRGTFNYARMPPEGERFGLVTVEGIVIRFEGNKDLRLFEVIHSPE